MNKLTGTTLLFIILFGAMFIFGYIENIKGVAFPLIKTEFDVTYEQQGMMVSISSMGYVLFCLIGGILLGSLGVKKAFITGYLLIILGLLAAFIMPDFWSLTVAIIIIFAGFGLFEVSSNALAAQLFTSRTALLMSLMHFFFGAGSAISPRAAGLLSAAMGWRKVYLLAIPLVLLLFIPSIFARFPKMAGAAEGGIETPGIKKVSFFAALKNPMVWIFSMALGIMVAVELSTPNWAGLYFQDVYQMDPKTSGAAFVSNFFIFFTISRLLSGFVIEKIGYLRSLFIAVFMVIFIFVIGFLLGPRGIYLLPAIGFFVAIFWPTILATAMGYFKKDAPVMTSAVIVIAGAINSILQFAIGLTNRLIGPAWGYRSCIVYAAIIIIVLLVLKNRMKHQYESHSSG